MWLTTGAFCAGTWWSFRLYDYKLRAITLPFMAYCNFFQTFSLKLNNCSERIIFMTNYILDIIFISNLLYKIQLDLLPAAVLVTGSLDAGWNTSATASLVISPRNNFTAHHPRMSLRSK